MLLTELVSWVFAFGLPAWLVIETLHHRFRVNRVTEKAPTPVVTSGACEATEPRPSRTPVLA